MAIKLNIIKFKVRKKNAVFVKIMLIFVAVFFFFWAYQLTEAQEFRYIRNTYSFDETPIAFTFAVIVRAMGGVIALMSLCKGIIIVDENNNERVEPKEK